jgi:hypothetical protein
MGSRSGHEGIVKIGRGERGVEPLIWWHRRRAEEGSGRLARHRLELVDLIVESGFVGDVDRGSSDASCRNNVPHTHDARSA